MAVTINYSNTCEALKLLEGKFKCCTCDKVASSPVTLGGCEHVFCRDCCEKYLGAACPMCNIPAHVKDAEVDRQLFTLATLCQKLREVLGVDGDKHQNMNIEFQDPRMQCTPTQSISGTVLDPCVKPCTPSQPISASQSDFHVTNIKDKTNAKAPKSVVNASPAERCTRSCSNSTLSITAPSMAKARKMDKKQQFSPTKNSSKQKGKCLQVFHKTITKNEDTDANLIVDKDKKGTFKDDYVSNTRSHTKAKTGLENEQIEVKKQSKPLNTRLRHSLNINMDISNKTETSGLDVSVNTTASKRMRRSATKQVTKRIRTSTVDKRKNVLVEVNDLPKHSLEICTSNATQLKSSLGDNKGNGNNEGFKTLKSTELNKNLPEVSLLMKRRSLRPHTMQSPVFNKRNAKGETPLQVAAIKNDIEKVRQLLQEGANPNIRDYAGWTPLHEACNHGYLEIAELLLDNGTLLNVPGLENATPLHDAVENNRVECVRLLVSRGASLTLRNILGQTAVDLAKTEEMKKALKTPVVLNKSSIATEPIDMLEYQAPCLLGTGLSREEKIILVKGSSQLQVKLVDDVTPEVTHIITKCNADGMAPRTIKIVQGILTGKWILSMEWLETCMHVGSLVCEEAFEVQGTSLFPNSRAPYLGRMNRKQQLPGLFDGCHFYCYGNYECATPSKVELLNIISAGGGKILLREPKPGHFDNLIPSVPYHADPHGELAHCFVFLVYESNMKFHPIRTKQMCSVPLTWIMDCASNFKLMPLPIDQRDHGEAL